MRHAACPSVVTFDPMQDTLMSPDTFATDAPVLDRSLGDLALAVPGAVTLFHRHGLDFCCGGRTPLRHAALAAGLSPEALAAELATLQALPAADGHDWRQASTPELIEHLLTRYHARHREQLDELLFLADRVERVHAHRAECPTGMAEHLALMAQMLEEHMQKEEQVLFPMLLQGHATLAQGPVAVLRDEHDDHGLALARMVELAHGLAMPEGACTKWRALILGLRALREDLMAHIHLENNLLFVGLGADIGAGNRATAGAHATAATAAATAAPATLAAGAGGCGGGGGCACAGRA